MESASVRLCTYCQNERPWIWSGAKLKDGSKVYVDDQGQRWAGRRCPQCEKARVQAAVRCDSFERDLIVRHLTDAGYEILSRTWPFKVAKEGRSWTVGVKRAVVEDNRVVLEEPVEPGYDLVVLIFASVRLLTAAKMEQLAPALKVQTPSLSGVA